jgi:hypothetical protein
MTHAAKGMRRTMAVALVAIASLLMLGPAAAPAGTTPSPPRIEGALGFPSQGKTVFRVSVDPRSARSMRNVVSVICFRGSCKFGQRLTSLGFFQASFGGPIPLGERVGIVAVACSRYGCSRATVRLTVAQPGSG